MYLKQLKIWNFRKYGSQNNEPGLIVNFHKNFNLLVGENDSGKTAIIDAIKLTLGTSSLDNNKIKENDFYLDESGKSTEELKIECEFSDLSEEEAGIFLDWLTFDEVKNYQLLVRLEAKKIRDPLTGERIDKVIKGGPYGGDSRLEGTAQSLLRTTYLKPLRDAENELKPGIKSRLAQILKNHKAFKLGVSDEEHKLVEIVKKANEEIKDFFDQPFTDNQNRTIKTDLQNYLNEFFFIPVSGEKSYYADFEVAQAKLNDILRKLSLTLDDTPAGLGSLNLLFIAAELLLYDEEKKLGARLSLIEEIEAHLHPQAQLRLIKYLQNSTNGQFILSTHSTTLAASIRLKHLILVHNSNAYPMGEEYTKLDSSDYKFLERFLDSTKANLFFARGVIFVEGDAENLLLPVIAEIIDRPLHKYGVSIVNIGNTAFKRYANIYKRSDEWLAKFSALEMPVSIVTDVDVRPEQYYQEQAVKNRYVYSLYEENKKVELEELGILPSDIVTKIYGTIFTTKTKVLEYLSEYNISLSSEDYEVLCQLLEKEMDQTSIEVLRKLKKEKIMNEFNDENGNLETFVAPNWTLEYEIALSGIRQELLHAIHQSRFINPNSKANEKKLEKIKEEIDGKIGEDVAYPIYKPLLKKQASKAVTAQILASDLLERKSEVKDVILKDPYLKYLRDAIYHVTEQESIDHD
ncbi:ATP-dependent endonuclease [Bacillus sp. S3]|uniref:ATP-dependent nuclease n=1 Tax=Bacillus sp. S3 TaxID=486398 RepID=UPI0011894840|nr:AAA family ATPase [Bacillus sp. S3]QCJ42589.1 ATP-dependent endonuclease [Bacillus sp. S3]